MTKTPPRAAVKSNRASATPTLADNVVDLEMSTGVDSHMGLRLWLRC